MIASVPEAARPGLCDGGAAKLISCILPDDGTERRLLAWLQEQGVTRANSVYCRGHSVLRKTKTRRNKLPEPELMRLVTIVVAADQADTLFAHLYERAEIHRPGGGALLMMPLIRATPFALPQDLASDRGARRD